MSGNKRFSEMNATECSGLPGSWLHLMNINFLLLEDSSPESLDIRRSGQTVSFEVGGWFSHVCSGSLCPFCSHWGCSLAGLVRLLPLRPASLVVTPCSPLNSYFDFWILAFFAINFFLKNLKKNDPHLPKTKKIPTQFNLGKRKHLWTNVSIKTAGDSPLLGLGGMDVSRFSLAYSSKSGSELTRGQVPWPPFCAYSHLWTVSSRESFVVRDYFCEKGFNSNEG